VKKVSRTHTRWIVGIKYKKNEENSKDCITYAYAMECTIVLDSTCAL